MTSRVLVLGAATACCSTAEIDYRGHGTLNAISLPSLLDFRQHARRYLNPFTANVDWEPIRVTDVGTQGVRAVVPIGSQIILREFAYGCELPTKQSARPSAAV